MPKIIWHFINDPAKNNSKLESAVFENHQKRLMTHLHFQAKKYVFGFLNIWLFTQTFFAKCDILSDFQTSCLASLAPFLTMDLEMKMSTFCCFLTLTKKWNIKFSLVINWRRRVIFLFFQLPVLCHVDFDFLPILLTYDIARFSSKTQQKADC